MGLLLASLNGFPAFVASQELGNELAERWGIPVQPYEIVIRGQQPVIPFQPVDTSMSSSGATFEQLSEDILPSSLEVTTTGNYEALTASEVRVLGATDTGAIFQQSTSVQTVNVQRRSPVALDPYIRGYRADQIHTMADGVFWPARRDLDSMLSKIDSALIEDAVVHAGPYGLRYGPGMAFITVVTADTPRYDEYESHFKTGFTFRDNGSQIYGREMVSGGSETWGYIIAWNIREGSDYEPGGDAPFERIPSSYESQNFHLQFGVDPTPESRVEFRYQRLDQTDTEYAVQFFDINFLKTDSFSATWTEDDPSGEMSDKVNAWFNSTKFNGNTDSRLPGLDDGPFLRKRGAFPVVDRVERAIDEFPVVALASGTTDLYGFTFGDTTSTGIRFARTLGDTEYEHMRVGAEFRYLEQSLNERFRIYDTNTGQLSTHPEFPANQFQTNMPDAEMITPGVFAEYSYPWTSFFSTSIGGRVDFAETDADAANLRDTTSIIGGSSNFRQHDTLFACYLMNEFEVSSVWDMNFGGGHAQRAPSLPDRYGDGVFLGIMQSGFNRVIGTPELRKESAWQLDFGLDGDYGWLKLGGDAFYAWINDYNLYQGDVASDPTGARLLRATNAELVTLTGVEVYGDVPISQQFSAFATFKYLEGRDRNIQVQGQPGTVDQPLYGIIPMESRAGLRLTDPTGEIWGFEFGSRIVNDQDQIARLRRGTGAILGFAPLELPTAGFTTFYVRSYWNVDEDEDGNVSLSIVGGVDNLFDRTYIEHLDLRLPPDSNAPAGDVRREFTQVFSPGITPYLGVEWVY